MLKASSSELTDSWMLRRLVMGRRRWAPTMLASVLTLLLGVVRLNQQACVSGLQIGLRQTFYDSPSDDYYAASNVDVGFEGRSRSLTAADDYEEAGERGYQAEDDGGSDKRGRYAGEAEDEAYAGYQSPAAAYEPRSSHRNGYEPVYHRKSKPSKGRSDGYNDDEDDDDDERGRHGYQDKKTKKKKVRPKVIIVKKIIPLSTTTAVG